MVHKMAPAWVAHLIGERHSDLLEHILWLRESADEVVQLWRVPSHLKVHGNDSADEFAMQGRLLHPNERLPLFKRR